MWIYGSKRLDKPVIQVDLFLKIDFSRYDLFYYSINTFVVSVITDQVGSGQEESSMMDDF